MEGSSNLGDEIPREIPGWLTATMAAMPMGIIYILAKIKFRCYRLLSKKRTLTETSEFPKFGFFAEHFVACW
jgi:hypothetical protein